MPVTFVGVSAEGAAIGSVTPVLPAGCAPDDLAIYAVETANQPLPTTVGAGLVAASDSGWTRAGIGHGTGPAGLVGGVRLEVFYKRLVTGSEALPATGDSGDHQLPRVLVFRGVDKTTPIVATLGGVVDPAAGSVTLGALGTSLGAGDGLLAIVATDRDISSGQATHADWTNSQQTMTEVLDLATALSTGGTLGAALGTAPAAGSSGSTATTLTGGSFTAAWLQIGLKQALAAVAATGIVAGAPVIASTVVHQGHTFTPPALLAGPAPIGRPAVVQPHILAPAGITAPVSFAVPALAQRHAFGPSVGVSSGAVSLAVPAGFTQRSGLSTAGSSTGPVSLGQPALVAQHSFTAAGLTTEPVALASPGLASAGSNFLAVGIASGAVALGAPAARQIHRAAAPGITAGIPSLGWVVMPTPEVSYKFPDVILVPRPAVTHLGGHHSVRLQGSSNRIIL